MADYVDPFKTRTAMKDQQRAPQSPDPAAIAQLLQLVMGQPIGAQPLSPFASTQQFVEKAK